RASAGLSPSPRYSRRGSMEGVDLEVFAIADCGIWLCDLLTDSHSPGAAGLHAGREIFETPQPVGDVGGGGGGHEHALAGRFGARRADASHECHRGWRWSLRVMATAFANSWGPRPVSRRG